MRQQVEVRATHPHGNADQAFSVLRELDRHVVTGEVIRSLTVEPLGDDLRVSHWDVKFRNGILRWSQRDEFDAATRTMRFELVDGDAEVLEGTWRMEDRADGCTITFSCEFDLGIPSLAEFLDPVAVRILGETVIAQLTDIFGPELVFDQAAEAARG
jgi:ribosome-associated toxin RatA of RatAB toxin-antitoxin module